jgi:hypothetical protein
VIASCGSEQQAASLLPLGVSATVEFRAPGRGRLIGSCTLDEAGHTALRHLLTGDSTRARLGTMVEITDSTGAVISTGTFRWNIRTRTAPELNLR